MLPLFISLFGAGAAALLAMHVLARFEHKGVAIDAEQASVLGRLGELAFGAIHQTEPVRDYVVMLDGRLRLAGQRQLSGRQFLGEAEGAGIVAAGTMLVLFGGALGGISIPLLIVCGLMGVGVAWLMLARAGNWITDRRRRLNVEFPYFLDLAVMTLDSGAGMIEVAEAYVRSKPTSALAEELRAVIMDLQMGTTTQSALLAMERRIPSDDVIAVTRAIRQGLKMGTPLAQIFREQADSMRFKRSQNAERNAEELKVKLQGPAMMLVISVLFLVLGPAVVGMITGSI